MVLLTVGCGTPTTTITDSGVTCVVALDGTEGSPLKGELQLFLEEGFYPFVTAKQCVTPDGATIDDWLDREVRDYTVEFDTSRVTPTGIGPSYRTFVLGPAGKPVTADSFLQALHACDHQIVNPYPAYKRCLEQGITDPHPHLAHILARFAYPQ